MRILTNPHRLSPRFPSLQILCLSTKSAPVPWYSPSKDRAPRSICTVVAASLYPGTPFLCFASTRKKIAHLSNSRLTFLIYLSLHSSSTRNKTRPAYHPRPRKKGRLDGPIPNSQFTRPSHTSPRTPHPDAHPACPLPKTEPPLPRAAQCTMRYSIFCKFRLNPSPPLPSPQHSAATNGQPGTPPFGRADLGIWKGPCDVTPRLCCSDPPHQRM